MAHSLASPPATATTPISTTTKHMTHFPSVGFQKVRACHQVSDNVHALNNKLVLRRTVSLGLAGAVFSSLNVKDPSANAAAKRPPPPPPKEKNDPNVSGVLAKVLASKKRKEAMKESMVKLREKGKPIQEPSQ